MANTWRGIIDDRVIAVLEDYIVTVDIRFVLRIRMVIGVLLMQPFEAQ